MKLQERIDQVFEHLCCYDREEWDELIADIRTEERERIARNIKAAPTARPSDREVFRHAARIAREGA